LHKYNAQGNLIWTRQIGTPGSEQATGVAADASGVYVAGYAYGTLPGQTAAGDIAVHTSGIYVVGVTDGVLPGQTNAGGRDIFVRKYNSQGNALWTRQIGTSGIDIASSVAGHTFGAFSGQINRGSGDAVIMKLLHNSPVGAPDFFSPGDEN
jgi:hypothetical protein